MTQIEKTFGLKLYKDEYNAAFILWVKDNFTYEKDTETKKSIYIYGTEEQLKKIQSCMFKSAEECSKVFVNFNTMEGEFDKYYKEIRQNTIYLTEEYLKFCHTPAYRGGETMNEEQLRIHGEIFDAIMKLRELL